LTYFEYKDAITGNDVNLLKIAWRKFVNLFLAGFKHLKLLWYPIQVKIARLAGGVPLFFYTAEILAR